MFYWYCRVYQGAFRIVSRMLPWRQPELLEGEKSLSKLPALIKSKGISSVLIVTDKQISSLGLMIPLLEGLQQEKIDYIIYDKTVPNPTIANIEEALILYKNSNSKGIIALGGGSAIDCAKGVGAREARPNKTIPQMRGELKIRRPILPLFAVPTTAGTGSEATVVSVVSDSATLEKYAINDMSLIPQYAVLDPLITVNLPPHLTATTGMDALTHAVEAYIGKSNTEETEQYAKEAVKLIFENLYEAYSNGENIIARTNMQKAAYLAGLAFTRAYVGYVHAIAHTLGGFYSVPHGLANAIIMPYVLDYYGEAAHQCLAELADVIDLGENEDTMEQKAGREIIGTYSHHY
ncbi:iron-containing alcohol dehydrogenase [Bacillus sp. S/N-304-OC-R1]|uniref:iron-containing alcohol dehydrogenase n=1 Tax=Bacillus sp. S/N-304-OC-R1 TaxID=2758034 RepID=UPI001C8D8C5D|nr:iron-containing alcohol dehydrogenase [Bacillus sp. S/N-304-OC-R1]MBY0121439.1 iron-containing alcohol dehydrogenase [Bacillus sp. S/N-304-OC-R1]